MSGMSGIFRDHWRIFLYITVWLDIYTLSPRLTPVFYLDPPLCQNTLSLLKYMNPSTYLKGLMSASCLQRFWLSVLNTPPPSEVFASSRKGYIRLICGIHRAYALSWTLKYITLCQCLIILFICHTNHKRSYNVKRKFLIGPKSWDNAKNKQGILIPVSSSSFKYENRSFRVISNIVCFSGKAGLKSHSKVQGRNFTHEKLSKSTM